MIIHFKYFFLNKLYTKFCVFVKRGIAFLAIPLIFNYKQAKIMPIPAKIPDKNKSGSVLNNVFSCMCEPLAL